MSLLLACIWAVLANVIAMLPSKRSHWPQAYALIAAGLSPGAALVFLITGPATNTATIVTVWKMLGRKATAIYLLSLLVISWLAGALFYASLST